MIIVQIDEREFMSCSCGYCQQFLLPCCHVCAVLKDIKHYEPSLFHIRLYKYFSYYYAHNVASKISPQTNKALNIMLHETRSSHYHASGKYRGVPLKNSKFTLGLPEFVHERFDKGLNAHSIIDLMTSILKHINEKGPVLKIRFLYFMMRIIMKVLVTLASSIIQKNQKTVRTNVQLILVDHHKLKVN